MANVNLDTSELRYLHGRVLKEQRKTLKNRERLAPGDKRIPQVEARLRFQRHLMTKLEMGLE